MWQRITNPDILIYLDVDFSAVETRRPRSHGGPERLADQHKKLAHARAHCDFYLNTTTFSPVQVQEQVLQFLREADIQPE
jgi:hypothetical protein